jgi:hypothetical protein
LVPRIASSGDTSRARIAGKSQRRIVTIGKEEGRHKMDKLQLAMVIKILQQLIKHTKEINEIPKKLVKIPRELQDNPIRRASKKTRT